MLDRANQARVHIYSIYAKGIRIVYMYIVYIYICIDICIQEMLCLIVRTKPAELSAKCQAALPKKEEVKGFVNLCLHIYMYMYIYIYMRACI